MVGAQMRIRGRLPTARAHAINKVLQHGFRISKSAMTPSLSGRIAVMLPGVRPTMRRASSPTATRLVSVSIVTTEGSSNTTPSLYVNEHVRRSEIDSNILAQHHEKPQSVILW